MSNFRGFKFTVSGYRKDIIKRKLLLDNEKNYLTYLILSESNGKLYIDEYSNGLKHSYDITENVDTFYNDIKDLNIQKWNMQTFYSPMSWFPPADFWTLDIHINDISVTCKGDDGPSENWNEFWEAFYRMCHDT